MSSKITKRESDRVHVVALTPKEEEENLEQLMFDMSKKAIRRGMTPKIAEEILGEEITL